MKITNHGIWHFYKPEKLPKDAPPNTMFTRRAGDGVDWYVYANTKNSFAPGTIKMTVIDNVVRAVVLDPTRLFPGNATVLEIDDVVVNDPQAAFGDKIYDAANKTFHDPPPPEPGPDLADLARRIEALERKPCE